MIDDNTRVRTPYSSRFFGAFDSFVQKHRKLCTETFACSIPSSHPITYAAAVPPSCYGTCSSKEVDMPVDLSVALLAKCS